MKKNKFLKFLIAQAVLMIVETALFWFVWERWPSVGNERLGLAFLWFVSLIPSMLLSFSEDL